MSFLHVQTDDCGETDGSTLLLCPICRCPNNHLEEVGTLLGDDEWDEPQTVLAGTDLGWRRNGVVLNYSCEEGHRWNLRIHQHKGNEWMFCDEGWVALEPVGSVLDEAIERTKDLPEITVPDGWEDLLHDYDRG